MSELTHLVLLTKSAFDPRPLAAMHAWCDAHEEPRLRRISTAKADSSKVFCEEAWMLCANYFPVDEFLDAFASFGFGPSDYDADQTILLAMHEDWDGWSAMRGDGEPVIHPNLKRRLTAQAAGDKISRAGFENGVRAAAALFPDPYTCEDGVTQARDRILALIRKERP
jgi:hypothetical protein